MPGHPHEGHRGRLCDAGVRVLQAVRKHLAGARARSWGYPKVSAPQTVWAMFVCVMPNMPASPPSPLTDVNYHPAAGIEAEWPGEEGSEEALVHPILAEDDGDAIDDRICEREILGEGLGLLRSFIRQRRLCRLWGACWL